MCIAGSQVTQHGAHSPSCQYGCRQSLVPFRRIQGLANHLQVSQEGIYSCTACRRAGTPGNVTDGAKAVAEDIASRLPKSTEPEGHDGSTGAAPKESDIADMVETRLQELVARLG